MIKELNNTNTVEKIRYFLKNIWIVLFILSYAAIAPTHTMIFMLDAMMPVSAFSVILLQLAQDLLIFVSLACVVSDYISDRNREGENCLLLLLAKMAVICIAYYVAYFPGVGYKNTVVWLMILFALTANAQNENRLLKIGFWIGTTVVLAAFFLSMLGIVENNRGNSFGFTYRTHYACFLMCMAMVWCLIKDGWLTWLGELGLLALAGYMLFAVGGKAALLSVAVLIVFTYWRHYRRSHGVPFQDREEYGAVIPLIFQIVYLPIRLIDMLAEKLHLMRYKGILLRVMKYSFPLSAAVIFLLTYSYHFFSVQWQKLSVFSSFVSRLYLVQLALEEFPLTLFGNAVSQAGNSGSENAVPLYFAIDGAYPKLLIQHGVVIFVLIIGLMTLAQYRLYKRNRYYAVFVLTIFAIDQTVEYWMIDLAYNLFILLALCKLSEKPGVEACTGLSLRAVTPAGRRGLAVCLTLLCVFVGLWCTTAYQITGWRGWTPDYGATLVIPGEYIDTVKSDAIRTTRLERAARYLSYRQDAACIVASEEDAKWLEAWDIAADRIFLDAESSDIDSMLHNAANMIETLKLPNRLTVCSYDIQQCAISRHASKLHIPVNSLTMKVPGKSYLVVFTAEQWRILCGK